MRQTNFALAMLVAATLAACGGSTGGDQTLKKQYSSQVTFGDSLADVGTYKVGAVVAMGGGQYTINGNNTTANPALTGKNWTELMAAQFGLPAPCAAQTGLDGTAPGFMVPVVDHPACFGYAQGGSRVTNPVGMHHKLVPAALGPYGQLTVPVVTQVANHLTKVGGAFSGTEIVFVIAGGNDVLMQLAALSAGATAAGTAAANQTFATTFIGLLASGATNPATAAQAIGLAFQTAAAQPGATQQSIIGAAVFAAASQPGNGAVGSQAVYVPMITQATTAATASGQSAGAAYAAGPGATAAVTAMGTAGAQLGALVNTQIVGKGAKQVVVNALPDVSISPGALAQSVQTRGLIKVMVETFNAQLKAAIVNEPRALYVDLYTVSHDQAINPGPYGLTITNAAACATNVLGGTSLICNGSTLIGGDVSHYMFADDSHPTPFEHMLIARYVSAQMAIKGWL